MATAPEGYSYQRCDRYTAKEFVDMFRARGRKLLQRALEYVMEHPKDVYDTDDEIAIVSGEHVLCPHDSEWRAIRRMQVRGV